MQALLVEALDAGAIGLSTGHLLSARGEGQHRGDHRDRPPLSARQGLYVTHMRDESSKVMEALDETFRIGRELGIPVVVSHHKVQNKPNWGRSTETLPFIREAMQKQKVLPRLLSVHRGLDHDPHRPRHARRPGADRLERAASRMRRPRARRDRAKLGRRGERGGAAACSRAPRSTS
jgi:N-acyl-D-aspartate/D-glutamate deacylase